MENNPSLYSLDFKELKDLVESLGHKSFRAKQIIDDLYKASVFDVDDFKVLPDDLKNKIKEKYGIFDMSIAKTQISGDGNTKKYLIRTKDNDGIEAVLMKYNHGYSLCISSQIGCRMGCTFCASTVNNLTRNLSTTEMIEQVAIIQNKENIRISNIVLMGIGEPLDNYDEVLGFIRKISSEKNFNISQRKITLSTCGIVEKIKNLADEGLQINLALSLHNPFESERRQLMPIARAFGIKETVDAIDYYIKRTGRRVSIEYALIKGKNDTFKHAKELAELFRNKLVFINLIPVNPVEGKEQEPTKDKEVLYFMKSLNNLGLNATIRRTLGTDIDAACGQLRNRS